MSRPATNSPFLTAVGVYVATNNKIFCEVLFANLDIFARGLSSHFRFCSQSFWQSSLCGIENNEIFLSSALCYEFWLTCSEEPQLPLGSVFWQCWKSVQSPFNVMFKVSYLFIFVCIRHNKDASEVICSCLFFTKLSSPISITVCCDHGNCDSEWCVVKWKRRWCNTVCLWTEPFRQQQSLKNKMKQDGKS